MVSPYGTRPYGHVLNSTLGFSILLLLARHDELRSQWNEERSHCNLPPFVVENTVMPSKK